MADRWAVVFLNDTVIGEFEAQPSDIKASFFRLVDLVVASGLENMHEPYVKHLQGKLWEMRLKGQHSIARALYITGKGRRVVVVRVFTKKTPKTAPSEIKLALKRAKEVA
jgi:phage-related protein